MHLATACVGSTPFVPCATIPFGAPSIPILGILSAVKTHRDEVAGAAALARRPLRVARPADLADVYRNPSKELSRLEQSGKVVRLAYGFYIAVPDDRIGTDWRPTLESAGLAIATAMQGDRVPVLMGLGAARFHRAIPRAVAVTTIAVPSKRNSIRLSAGGEVVFVARDVDRLEARLERLDLGSGLVTTVEQTAFDLLMRPGLGGMSAGAAEAVTNLAPRVDAGELQRIASRHGRMNDAVRALISRREEAEDGS
ncbi:hypothetical protein ITJ66_01755 [Plantibacter sp. VKM Ac-2885]|uniref:type IV toxin-antitoxin system AbiEi family antitoxin domain-containing protein n=1 Tax=Plantibacter sp. VKM Ac-2885 TaxID=2783828 RepID=UPI001889D78C|nr:hypothetical protein [Plantibacter sp. VKM Ac-2885]MBF4511195.1 hypothetical protein [Plantibacter sp. VKM Ac-2885]